MIGNEAARERLRELVKRGKVAHAYLFAGPRGVGKFTAALEFARSLLCSTACGTCSDCRRINQGTHPAVTIIRPPEGKQGIPIEAVREFIAHSGLTWDTWRVAIFDGAETMSEEAMNALLKTLEEPPPRVVVILVASAVGQVLPTIVSRCHVVLFHALSDEELRASLTDLKLSDSDFVLLRDLASGSAGEARKLAALLPGLREDVSAIVNAATTGNLTALVEKSKDRERGRFILNVLLAEQRRALERGEATAVERLDALLRSQIFLDRNANVTLTLQDALLTVGR